MDSLFEQAFNKVFNNPASCAWRQGYSDAVEGKRCASNDTLYLEGYALGYEKGEKESARSTQETI